jgi:hypothetical protein
VKKGFRERQILAIKIQEIQELKREYDREKNQPPPPFLPIAESITESQPMNLENTMDLLAKAH